MYNKLIECYKIEINCLTKYKRLSLKLMNKKFVLLSLEDWSKKRKEINYSVDHKLILWIEKVGLSILISN